MYYLYGTRKNGTTSLVAKFDSEQQLQTYVRYATLGRDDEGNYRFEQQTALSGCIDYHTQSDPGDDDTDVPLNPSPTML